MQSCRLTHFSAASHMMQICDHHIDIFCITETWLQQEDHVSINESTPSDYLNVHVPRTTGHKSCAVAAGVDDVIPVDECVESPL